MGAGVVSRSVARFLREPQWLALRRATEPKSSVQEFNDGESHPVMSPTSRCGKSSTGEEVTLGEVVRAR